MKKNLDNNSTEWITDQELKKILKIDEFDVSHLIRNLDLLAYGIDEKIRHFYEEEEGPSELPLEIGSLKFSKKEVDELIKNYLEIGNSEKGKPELYLWRLKNRLKNIQYLEQIRDQQYLETSPYLERQKSITKEQIEYSEKAVLQNGLPENVVNLIKEAKPEIEKIWGALKNVGFSGHRPDASKEWEEAAQKEYKKNKNNFKLVKIEHLSDEKMYLLTGGQEKRDFIGTLLQKIVKPKYGKIGKDKLFRVYKTLK